MPKDFLGGLAKKKGAVNTTPFLFSANYLILFRPH